MVKLDRKVREALRGATREHLEPVPKAHDGSKVVARLQLILPPGAVNEDDIKFQVSALQGVSYVEALDALQAALLTLRSALKESA